MEPAGYSPDDLLAKYYSIRSQVPTDVFYSDPKYRKTMELWCAAQFARGYAANLAPCCLVLVHEEDAQTYWDFQLEIGARRLDFQLTEVLQAGRRRGDEYRKNGPGGYTTVNDYEKGETLGGEWISSAIKKKYEKYGGDVSTLNLLVYVNFLADEHPYLKLCDQVADVTAYFRSVWLLDGHAIACLSTKDGDLNALTGWMFVPDHTHNKP